MSESREAFDAERDAADAEAAFRDLGEEISAQFAAWAQANGILARITEDQCADLALAWMAGWAHADAWRKVWSDHVAPR